jgi:hypothetical protein
MTYMGVVGQSIDPWDVPTKWAVEVMQEIWDVTNEVTTSTVIYQKVHGKIFIFSITNIYF